MVGFAFVGPIALTLATQLVVPKSLVAPNADAKDASGRGGGFALGTLLAGLLTPVIFVLLTINTWFNLLGIDLTPRSEIVTSVAIVGMALLLTVGQLLRLTTFSIRGLWAYSKAYLALFLCVFTGLWLYALPDYFSAVEGITSQGYPVGSLPYVLGCSGFAAFFLLRERR
jgi:hypothetical protein